MSDNDVTLTAEEQAALDAQRNGTVEPQENAPETPQEGATGTETVEGGVEPPQPPQRTQMVPHEALHEERERRKQAEARAAEVERRAEERFRALLEKLGPQPAAEPPAPAPDPEKDPIGYIVGNLGDLRNQVQNLSQSQAQQAQADEQARALQAMQQHAMALEAEYRRDNADYEPALAFLGNLRHQQLIAAGITNPVQRQKMIGEEAMGITYHALQNQQNPAAVLHNIAKASGFTAPPAGNGQPAAAAAPTEATRLDTIARGQQQAQNLGNVRGAGPSPITANKLQEMSNDDFLELMKKPPAEVRRMMGM